MNTMMLYGFVVAVGAVVGSFLNVCIHRIPKQQSIVWPASHCPVCGTAIAPYDNIPVVSYFLLRGRCRHCSGRISLQYPAVEAANALGYGLILWRFGLGWPALVYAALFSALLVVAVIDLEHQIIPNVVTLPGIPLGLLCASTILPVGFPNSVIGGLLGGGLLWGLAWASPYLFGKEGMGGGDIKLLTMIGAFLGWKPTLLTILIGAVVGSAVGLTMMALKLLRRNQYVPFGPFLALGAMTSLFFHEAIWAWYLGFFGLDK